jgi:lipopolysaccharide export system ATP-binding protein
MALLSLKNLNKTYNDRRVVNGVNLQVESGKVVGLLGPNGAGKTTTFYMAVGMVSPDDGRIFLDDTELTHYPMFQRARRGIGYLPQEASIFRTLTVRQNVMVILETLNLTKEEREERATRLLDELRIKRLSNQKAAVLSGGERRRLEISRVLCTNPTFVLLDEPFAGVDPIAVIDIQKIITLLTERGIGVLISDHNVRETLGVCDTAYILDNGEVIEHGSPDKIASSEIARKRYLGNEFRL